MVQILCGGNNLKKIKNNMHIKIFVAENEKAELDKFIETCKEHGMQIIREGGGNLPNFS